MLRSGVARDSNHQTTRKPGKQGESNVAETSQAPNFPKLPEQFPEGQRAPAAGRTWDPVNGSATENIQAAGTVALRQFRLNQIAEESGLSLASVPKEVRFTPLPEAPSQTGSGEEEPAKCGIRVEVEWTEGAPTVIDLPAAELSDSDRAEIPWPSDGMNRFTSRHGAEYIMRMSASAKTGQTRDFFADNEEPPHRIEIRGEEHIRGYNNQVCSIKLTDGRIFTGIRRIPVNPDPQEEEKDNFTVYMERRSGDPRPRTLRIEQFDELSKKLSRGQLNYWFTQTHGTWALQKGQDIRKILDTIRAGCDPGNPPRPEESKHNTANWAITTPSEHLGEQIFFAQHRMGLQAVREALLATGNRPDRESFEKNLRQIVKNRGAQCMERARGDFETSRLRASIPMRGRGGEDANAYAVDILAQEVKLHEIYTPPYGSSDFSIQNDQGGSAGPGTDVVLQNRSKGNTAWLSASAELIRSGDENVLGLRSGNEILPADEYQQRFKNRDLEPGAYVSCRLLQSPSIPFGDSMRSSMGAGHKTQYHQLPPSGTERDYPHVAVRPLPGVFAAPNKPGQPMENERVLRTALMHFQGRTFEDAVVMSEAAAKIMSSEFTQTETFEETAEHRQLGITCTGDHRLLDLNAEDTAHLDKHGCAIEGTKIEPGMILVGRFKRGPDGVEDVSIRAPGGMSGTLVKVQRENAGRERFGEIGRTSFAVECGGAMNPGDKIGNSCGVKGVASILPDEQMPIDENGNRVDLIVSPLGMLARQAAYLPAVEAPISVALREKARPALLNPETPLPRVKAILEHLFEAGEIDLDSMSEEEIRALGADPDTRKRPVLMPHFGSPDQNPDSVQKILDDLGYEEGMEMKTLEIENGEPQKVCVGHMQWGRPAHDAGRKLNVVPHGKGGLNQATGGSLDGYIITHGMLNAIRQAGPKIRESVDILTDESELRRAMGILRSGQDLQLPSTRREDLQQEVDSEKKGAPAWKRYPESVARTYERRQNVLRSMGLEITHGGDPIAEGLTEIWAAPSSEIRERSSGEIRHDRDSKIPIEERLRDPKIFGNTKNPGVCACGKTRTESEGRRVCPDCGVKRMDHKEASRRFAHIELSVPMLNPLAYVRATNLKGLPAEQTAPEIAQLLGITAAQLRRTAESPDYRIEGWQGYLQTLLDRPGEEKQTATGASVPPSENQLFQEVQNPAVGTGVARIGAELAAIESDPDEALREANRQFELARKQIPESNPRRNAILSKLSGRASAIARFRDNLSKLAPRDRRLRFPSNLIIDAVPVPSPVHRPSYDPDDRSIRIPNRLDQACRRILEADSSMRETLTASHSSLVKRQIKERSIREMNEAVLRLYGDPAGPGGRKEAHERGLLDLALGKNGIDSRTTERIRASGSAYGVITPGVDIPIGSIGIPRDVAWGLFHPFFMNELIRVKKIDPKEAEHEARRAFEDEDHENHALLLNVLSERQILGTRHPHLHAHSTMSFTPVLNPRGVETFELESTTAEPLGGDHDGDTMIFHVLPHPEAQELARIHMNPRHNPALMLKTGSGKLQHRLKQEYASGLLQLMETEDGRSQIRDELHRVIGDGREQGIVSPGSRLHQEVVESIEGQDPDRLVSALVRIAIEEKDLQKAVAPLEHAGDPEGQAKAARTARTARTEWRRSKNFRAIEAIENVKKLALFVETYEKQKSVSRSQMVKMTEEIRKRVRAAEAKGDLPKHSPETLEAARAGDPMSNFESSWTTLERIRWFMEEVREIHRTTEDPDLRSMARFGVVSARLKPTQFYRMCMEMGQGNSPSGLMNGSQAPEGCFVPGISLALAVMNAPSSVAALSAAKRFISAGGHFGNMAGAVSGVSVVENACAEPKAVKVKAESLGGFEIGRVLAADVKNRKGEVLAKKNTVLHQEILNAWKNQDLESPIQVYSPGGCGAPGVDLCSRCCGAGADGTMPKARENHWTDDYGILQNSMVGLAAQQSLTEEVSQMIIDSFHNSGTPHKAGASADPKFAARVLQNGRQTGEGIITEIFERCYDEAALAPVPAGQNPATGSELRAQAIHDTTRELSQILKMDVLPRHLMIYVNSLTDPPPSRSIVHQREIENAAAPMGQTPWPNLEIPCCRSLSDMPFPSQRLRRPTSPHNLSRAFGSGEFDRRVRREEAAALGSSHPLESVGAGMQDS